MMLPATITTSTRVIWEQAESLPFYSPGGSSDLQLHVWAAGFDPKSPLSMGSQGLPSNVEKCCTTDHVITHHFDDDDDDDDDEKENSTSVGVKISSAMM